MMGKQQILRRGLAVSLGFLVIVGGDIIRHAALAQSSWRDAGDEFRAYVREREFQDSLREQQRQDAEIAREREIGTMLGEMGRLQRPAPPWGYGR